MTGYLKPGVVTVYAHGDVKPLLLKHRLKKDPQGNVEILKTFWTITYDWQRADIAPPLLIYADLLAIAEDRTIDTAKRIYDDYLAGSFEGA